MRTMRIMLMIAVLTHLSCTTNTKENKIKGDYILEEVPRSKATCGIFSVWVGMQFKKKDSDFIFVGLVHCPEMYEGRGYGEEFFTGGKIYELIATNSYTLNPDELIENEYSNSDFPIYKIEELKRKDKPTSNTQPEKLDVRPLSDQ